MLTKAGTLTYTKGAPKYFVSSTAGKRRFCEMCGSQLVWQASDPAEDWMVGQVAARRLVDRQGRTIVEKGQTITAAIVAMASRTGMLHRLEGNPR